MLEKVCQALLGACMLFLGAACLGADLLPIAAHRQSSWLQCRVPKQRWPWNKLPQLQDLLLRKRAPVSASGKTAVEAGASPVGGDA